MATDRPHETWSRRTRMLVSAAITLYLAIVILAPLTIPIGAPHLTMPVARLVAPIHQAGFMSHGYRFFGPDPGPSHALVYEVTQADGSVVKDHFPNRESTSPRLRYHRWFMLSESFFLAASQVPTDEQQQQRRLQYEQQKSEFSRDGKYKLQQQLSKELDQEVNAVKAATRRRDHLLRSIAKSLLERHQGSKIKLWLQQRNLPTPEEVASGMLLTDSTLIEQLELGSFEAAGLKFTPPPKFETIVPLEKPGAAQ